MTTSRRDFLALPLAVPLLAQQPPKPAPPEDETPTIKVDVDLVNIFCSVREKNGPYVANLAKDDFTLLEDNKAQTLKFFTRETNLPLTIGLLVDVSRSQENLIDVEREASLRFFQKVIRQKDMVFAISFGVDSELLQDCTNSISLLRKALAGLRLNAGTNVGGIINPGPIPTQQRGTVLYEAVYLAADEKLRSEVGRKAIIVITDGDDYGSRIKIEKAIEAAQRSDAIIYSVLFEDPRYTSPMYGGVSGEGPMRKMSDETGGRVFRVSGKQTLDQIYDQIQDELRSQYALGYTPTNSARDGSFRRIEIKMSRKDLRVQARKGYYAGKG
jgi:VWFA-related protein